MPTIEANGVTLNYRIDGPPDAPVIAFSNSLGTTLAMWDAQVAALSGGFRCLRYDTRGHGQSSLPRGKFSVEVLAEDLAALMEGLGIGHAHVVGLSLGGMTGQALAAARPDLVDRLILVATSSYLPPVDLWLDRAQMVRARGMGSVAENVVGRWFTPLNQTSDGALATRRRLEEEISPEGYAACCEAIGAMDLRERIGAVTAPTLVISGGADPSTPPIMGEEIAARIPGAEFIVVPETAHMIAVERAETLNGLILSFLGGSAAAAPDRTGSGGPATEIADGLGRSRTLLGDAEADRIRAEAGAFGAPWQDFVARYAFGEAWGDETLPWKTRSLVTLALTAALGQEDEFKLHLRPALRNGVTPDELRSLLKHSAVYAGLPAGTAAFRWVREVLGEELA
ncbi:3-oxoadipate enol-lactonase [Enterovirga rhinocerotis]|uniref:3-oxoadipate enol-lactonase/4-carboxymuconolactone decarboxylase n=1 Tax=Enterovirga rhinocerotis TaxID=1339210 RepID=A0A4R7BV38_9HYPH|nr:3-oxoadipate enol-lactonase [Enterovirga rhinocerotis]TDR89684.1 3-oxoadipate enol-lactonase/4-carboxymuconolactone decarboxylase [Enterovirga rhinocerotis]